MFGLFRMHQKQNVNFRRGRKHGGRGQPTSRFVRKLGPLDQLVEWFKPEQKPKWMTKKQVARRLQLLVRELRYHLQKADNAPASSPSPPRFWIQPVSGGKDQPTLRPALAGRDPFAQLKTGMKMSQLKCRSAEGIKKELLICFITYNLIRRIIRDAAGRQQVERDESASSMHYAGWPTPATAMN